MEAWCDDVQCCGWKEPFNYEGETRNIAIPRHLGRGGLTVDLGAKGAHAAVRMAVGELGWHLKHIK